MNYVWLASQECAFYSGGGCHECIRDADVREKGSTASYNLIIINSHNWMHKNSYTSGFLRVAETYFTRTRSAPPVGRFIATLVIRLQTSHSAACGGGAGEEPKSTCRVIIVLIILLRRTHPRAGGLRVFFFARANCMSNKHPPNPPPQPPPTCELPRNSRTVYFPPMLPTLIF